MTTSANTKKDIVRAPLAFGAGIASLLLLAAAVIWVADRPPVTAGPGITVPPGFEWELAAGPPLVERPIVVDMDEQGRLYVAESSGSNDHVQDQLAEKPHSILRLVDSDGDGRYDTRTVFADKMMFPEGVLWHAGSLYVAAPPSIWKLTDTDDDGVADRREEWFNGKTLTNCANDLHGPYVGPDGWIYWCKGAFAEQTYERPGRPPFVTRASHIFRRRAEGGLIEPVLTGGMDNPVEVAFSPEGERFLTSTFIEQPRAGLRDGLLHAVYGGVYGKVHNVTDSHQQTGGLQPALANLGAAVPVGLAYYSSTAFGEEYQGNLFATLFNLHKIGRFVLKPRGASFETEIEDFLVSSSDDFHPTDVMEDADGSLLVVDTGAWYVLCCPSSFLSKPDVHGAIYRVRRRGAKPIDDPRGLSLDWVAATPADLAGRLGDSRHAVRKRAIQQLGEMGGDAVPVLAETIHGAESAAARQNAVWALTRIAGPEARQAVRAALEDNQESVRHAAIHSVSVWRDTAATAALLNQLEHSPAPLQRAAAEALGRIGDSAAIPALLDATARTDDEILTHSLTYALIEIDDPLATRQGLAAADSRVRRAAMIALDQMDHRRLEPGTVIPLLSSNDTLLRETASWIVARHVEWGSALSGYFRARLSAPNLDKQAAADLESELARFSADAAIQDLLAQTVRGNAPRPATIAALGAMARAPVKATPPSWTQALTAVLSSGHGDLLQKAISTAQALPVEEKRDAALEGALLKVGLDANVESGIRLNALAASAASLPSVPAELFEFLISHIGSSIPVSLRSGASRSLATAPLGRDQLATLAAALAEAGPLELPTLLGAFDGGGDESLGAALAEALKDARGLSNLRADTIENAFAKFPESVQAKGQALLASLDVDRGQQKAHLEDLLASFEEGDVRRGRDVFRSTKAACSSCHRIGYLGGRIGPDLTSIEKIRQKRDLLESILYPSATLVRNFEPLVIVTADETHNGVPIEETDSYILLATGTDTQVRVNRDSIQEMRPGAVSIMPAGLEDELTRTELADLLAFLMQSRWSASARR
ncbi:MAG: HEAT repeat domain-containing protein [Acidobacteria bacterium]|nr:HEAT repeat domain-containing protein [Acidobacteriota bacterium]